MKIKIRVGTLVLDAILSDTPTATKIAGILPLSSRFNTWGDEIYFPVPVQSELEANAAEEVKIGDLGYWPTGRAFCIFFGPTPLSGEGKIIPASAVNVIGHVTGDATALKEVMLESDVEIVPDAG
jgi:hypothetical protein